MARAPDLERRVLDALWRGGEWSVRDVHLDIDPALAHTTFATVLDRLHEKGEVDREKVDGTWRYRAARSREAALAAEVGAVLARAEGAPDPLLVAFLDRVEQVDPRALDRLEALIQARRQRG
ncbi:BlaI/MecI/CopY family transcriptional regulator [Myxococcota bacterium]|jgi:predicted transcriptional regulator|nr:BlaI/MecI/CopY family transcriptional regulator [Myxococcota bacterium]